MTPPVIDDDEQRYYSSQTLTALIPSRWPYAPEGAEIRLMPEGTFTGRWGGRWDFQKKVAFVNQGLAPEVGYAVCAHELGHGRWSAPLPDMPGEEGSAYLVLEMFDEVRVAWFAVRAHPPVREDLRPWVLTGGQATATNVRGVALLYGYLSGHVHAGILDDEDVHMAFHQIEDAVGPRWMAQLDSFLVEAFNTPPGENAALAALARRWDRWVAAS
jgi:hypothetical protein